MLSLHLQYFVICSKIVFSEVKKINEMSLEQKKCRNIRLWRHIVGSAEQTYCVFIATSVSFNGIHKLWTFFDGFDNVNRLIFISIFSKIHIFPFRAAEFIINSSSSSTVSGQDSVACILNFSYNFDQLRKIQHITSYLKML